MSGRYKLSLVVMAALIVVMAILATLPNQAIVSAAWNEPEDDSMAIYSVAVGVYTAGDIGTWYRGDNEALNVNPSNPINRISVTVIYNESRVLNPSNLQSCLFVEVSIHEQYTESYQVYYLSFQDANTQTHKAVFSVTGINYQISANTNFIIEVTYRVIIA